jgi:2-C-methyl-D-erythritol 4-phosphate cytidylyltransferase
MSNLGIILVAGGSSTRFGADKQFALLAGLPVFLHSVRAFLPCATELVLVVPSGRQEDFHSKIVQYKLDSPKIRYAVGGATRSESVQNGLAALSFTDGIVAIHDAARPLATAELLMKLVEAAEKFGGAAPAHPVTDTLLVADDANKMTGVQPREHLWQVATPQVFQLQPLLTAYRHAAGQPFTDDTQVFFHDGGHVQIVPDSSDNLKITYPEDLSRAESILLKNK